LQVVLAVASAKLKQTNGELSPEKKCPNQSQVDSSLRFGLAVIGGFSLCIVILVEE